MKPRTARYAALCLILALLLTGCQKKQEQAADLLRSGRQDVEASRCVGVNRYADAIADLQAATAADRDLFEAYYWLYVAQNGSGDAEAAARVLTNLETVVAGANVPEGEFWLLKLYDEKGDAAASAAALAQLEAASASDPGNADAHYWLGRAYYDLGQLDQALQSFKNGLTMNPEHNAAHFWAGQTYTDQGQFPQALQEFDLALRFDPDNVAAYHNRGTVAYRLGNLDQARSDLQTALERDPDDPRSHYQMGAIYLALALPASQDLLATPDPALLEQSRVAFAAALERCPGMLESLIGMGNLYIIQGDPTAALVPLNQAIEQAPDQPETWFALAQAHAMLGQTETACGNLDQFLSLSVPTEWQEQAEQMRTELDCP